MIECSEVKILIHKVLDGLLLNETEYIEKYKDEYKELLSHIDKCSSCKNEYNIYIKILKNLKSLQIPLPINFDNKLHLLLLKSKQKQSNPKPFIPVIAQKKGVFKMINSAKLKKFIHDNRSYIISTGIHLLLLLLFLNIIVLQQSITTPTFVTKIITNQPIEIKKQEIQMKREEQRPDAGSEGLEGLKGGGMSSPKLQQQLMIKQAQVKQVNKVFTPLQNLRTQVREIFVPKTQIAVKETKVRSDFRVPMQPRTSINAPISGSNMKMAPQMAGDRNTVGLAVPGDYSDVGRPDGVATGTGIGEQKSGSTGRGGGTGVGFFPYGTGTGSGNQGTGPGAGRQGRGAGFSGTGTGPGSGPGISIAPGGGQGTAIVGAAQSSQSGPMVTNTPSAIDTTSIANRQVSYKPDAPLGSQENPISEIYIAVEFNGESGFTHDFYLAYPENRLLIRNARLARSEVIRLGPYAVPPEQFLFYWHITANQWGLDRGVPLYQTIYTTDTQQVRVRKVSENTIRYFLEDMPVSLPTSDRDYDDVIITIVYKGAAQR
ncbi:MAG: hypothetical protein RMJ67_00985 [Elusimicrobiota bacterium]|nr:hypothetical protein [Endomicrobiia bacterium]MDW8165077.1 hypothetical protein [Elusimicrobiota bacterium]